MSPTYVNVHGRKPHRGVRPFLLVPKVLAVAWVLGGLAAVMMLLLRQRWRGDDTTTLDTTHTLATITLIYQTVILPGAIASGLLGVLLWLQMPWVFLRLRWFQLKMALILLVLPGVHVGSLWAAQHQHIHLLLALVITAVILTTLTTIIGRVKPNLRQNWAKDYPRS